MAAEKEIDSLASRILDLDHLIEQSRFSNVVDTSVIVDQQKNKNTWRMTDCHVKLFKSWLANQCELRDPAAIASQDLNQTVAYDK